MEYRCICVVLLCASCTVLVLTEEEAEEYEYEFSIVEYIKEAPNTSMLREPSEYLCRLPDEERVKICKEALQQEFAVKHGIEYVDTEPLGKEKMYECKVTSGLYVVDCPLFVSACTCPTKPLIYLKNKHCGIDVRAYVKLPSANDDERRSNHTPPSSPTNGNERASEEKPSSSLSRMYSR